MLSAAAASSSNELANFIVIYDTISATPCTSDTYYYPDNLAPAAPAVLPPPPPPPSPPAKVARGGGNDVGRSKKRRRKARVCKNKEEAETQRMTHIAVERNRRKLMNEHLALLRSLMPPSYVQRGDQASIVAGAIEFVKELEHSLHSLQAKKLHHPSPPTPLFSQFFNHTSSITTQDTTNNSKSTNSFNNTKTILTTSSSSPSSSSSNDEDDGIVGIEVTLIETHANLRFLTRKRSTNRRPWQLSKLVGGFHALRLSVLHFSLTTVHPFSLYSISAKVEEGCQLTSVDDIAAAVHHMLRLIIEQDEEDHHHGSSSLLHPHIT